MFWLWFLGEQEIEGDENQADNEEVLFHNLYCFNDDVNILTEVTQFNPILPSPWSASSLSVVCVFTDHIAAQEVSVYETQTEETQLTKGN